jgi:hypothetical protein
MLQEESVKRHRSTWNKLALPPSESRRNVREDRVNEMRVVGDAEFIR